MPYLPRSRVYNLRFFLGPNVVILDSTILFPSTLVAPFFTVWHLSWSRLYRLPDERGEEAMSWKWWGAGGGGMLAAWWALSAHQAQQHHALCTADPCALPCYEWEYTSTCARKRAQIQEGQRRQQQLLADAARREKCESNPCAQECGASYYAQCDAIRCASDPCGYNCPISYKCCMRDPCHPRCPDPSRCRR